MQKTLPPAVQEYFEQEKRAQHSHVQVAQAKRNVRQTLDTFAFNVLPQLGERGQQLDVVVHQADELEESSSDFLYATQPSWRQWLRTWKPPLWWWPRCMFRWCACCCHVCYKRKRVLFNPKTNTV